MVSNSDSNSNSDTVFILGLRGLLDMYVLCMTWLPMLCGQLGRLFDSKHTSNSHLLLLPDDVIVNIFSRLDAECAFQCSRLCKSLSTILSNPYFLSAHCFRSTPSLIVQFFECRSLHDRSGFGFYGRDIVLHCIGVSGNIVALRLKFKSRYVWPEFDCSPLLVGSYNGLLLFDNHSLSQSAFYIWNPLTQEQVTLIAPSRSYHVCGFYFHSSTGEYRVLYSRLQNTDSQCFILSLGTKLLREISSSSLGPNSLRPPVILNGVLHWTTSYCSSSFCSNFILSFKTDSEVFTTIPHPRIENCSSQRHNMMHLLDVEGKLGLCDVISATELHVWVLQEKEVWVRMHKISTKSVLPKECHFIMPTLEALYIQNGELLLKSHRQLHSFDLKLNTSTAIGTNVFRHKTLNSIVVHSNSMTSLHTDEVIFLDNLELQEL